MDQMLFNHSDNYIEANPLVTPKSIVPEWYLLAYYTVLRTVPDKLGGVIMMGMAIAVLGMMPWLDKSVIRVNRFRPINKVGFWVLVGMYYVMVSMGARHIEYPYTEIAKMVTIGYFMYFIVWVPSVSRVTNVVMM